MFQPFGHTCIDNIPCSWLAFPCLSNDSSLTSVKVAGVKSSSVVTFLSEVPSKVSPISSVLPPSAVLVFFTASVLLLVDSMGTSSTNIKKKTWY